jgi:hypothetical protein
MQPSLFKWWHFCPMTIRNVQRCLPLASNIFLDLFSTTWQVLRVYLELGYEHSFQIFSAFIVHQSPASRRYISLICWQNRYIQKIRPRFIFHISKLNIYVLLSSFTYVLHIPPILSPLTWYINLRAKNYNIFQLSPTTCYFLPSSIKYLSQHQFHNTSSLRSSFIISPQVNNM